jgi:hypothetical protein
MMALRDRISIFKGVATATIATVATLDRSKEQKQVSSSPSVAKVATVAVARAEKPVFQPAAEIVTPAAEVNPWGWLRPVSDRQTCYAGKDQGPSCFSCKSYNGKGSSWPGMCRYPENIGQAALEIDWNVVDPARGCGCYEPDVQRIAARDKDTDFRHSHSWNQEATGGPSSNDKPEALPTPCREYITKGVTKRYPLEDSPKLGSRISPVALSWLAENRVQLKAAGWTGRELYRRNKSKGIAWCSLWDQPFLKVFLHDNGVMQFECVIAGKDIIQTARPMKQARELQGDKSK